MHVPAVAIEQHIAEKLHAYTRTYAADMPSSRVKDLVDLVVIAHTILRRYAGNAARYRRTRRRARNLLKIWPALWTFSQRRGVEPTNNHAERGLRGTVIHRKLNLGSQSEEGERRIARLLSAHTTCRLQHRSLHAYFVDLLSATAHGDPPPLPA